MAGGNARRYSLDSLRTPNEQGGTADLRLRASELSANADATLISDSDAAAVAQLGRGI